MYDQNHNFEDEYYFTIPTPDHTGSTIGEDGRIHVKNLSAFWIPKLTVVEVIHGCTYTVTGSYDGDKNFLENLERVTTRNFSEKLEETL